MRVIIITLLSIISLLGCESTGKKGDLQAVNNSLKQEIAAAKSEIGQLKATNTLLNKDIEELKNVISVLDTEKSSRVKESSVLRGQVRSFVQNQVDGLKQFLVKGDLLDYVGGELVQRNTIEDKGLTVFDLANTIPSAGVLTGVGAFVIKPSTMKVKVLRNIDNKLVTIWESQLIEMFIAGLNRHQFTNTVGVEPGDIIAYEFPTNVGVGYDIGTGDSRNSTERLSLGQSIQLSSLLNKNDKRSYSLGVYGLLNQ